MTDCDQCGWDYVAGRLASPSFMLLWKSLSVQSMSAFC